MWTDGWMCAFSLDAFLMVFSLYSSFSSGLLLHSVDSASFPLSFLLFLPLNKPIACNNREPAGVHQAGEIGL